MRRRRALLAFASCSPLAAPGLLRAQGGAPAVMRLSHQFPPSHHNARVLAAFAEDAKARSGGAVEVQVFRESNNTRLSNLASFLPGELLRVSRSCQSQYVSVCVLIVYIYLYVCR